MAGDTSIQYYGGSKFRIYYKVALVFVHPKYDDFTKHNDIAVIRTRNVMEIIVGIIVPIYLSQRYFAPDTVCSLAGWGQKNKSENTYSMVQNKVHVPIISDNNCSVIFGDIYNKRLMVCGGILEGGHDGCGGDSGGGLICQNRLYGVLSAVTGCGSPFFPSIYADVRSYKFWISRCFLFRGEQSQVSMPPYLSAANLKNIDFFSVCFVFLMLGMT